MSSPRKNPSPTQCFSLRSYNLAITGTLLTLQTVSLLHAHHTSSKELVTFENGHVHVIRLNHSIQTVSWVLAHLTLVYRMALVRALYTKHVPVVRFLVNLEVFFYVLTSLFVGAFGMTLFQVQEEGRSMVYAIYGAIVLGMVLHGLIYTLPLWRYKKALMKEAIEAKACEMESFVEVAPLIIVNEKAELKKNGKNAGFAGDASLKN
jgi:hypothetical protein